MIESIDKFEDIGFFSGFFHEFESNMRDLPEGEFFCYMSLDIMSRWGDKVWKSFLIFLWSDIYICVGIVLTHFHGIHRDDAESMRLHLFIEEDGLTRVSSDGISQAFLSKVHDSSVMRIDGESYQEADIIYEIGILLFCLKTV